MKQCTVSMAVGAFVIYRSSDIYERWMLLAASTPPHLRDICSLYLCSSWCILKVGMVVIQRSHMRFLWSLRMVFYIFGPPRWFCDWNIQVTKSPQSIKVFCLFFFFFSLTWKSHDFPLSGEEACRKRFPFVFALSYVKRLSMSILPENLNVQRQQTWEFFAPIYSTTKWKRWKSHFPGKEHWVVSPFGIYSVYLVYAASSQALPDGWEGEYGMEWSGFFMDKLYLEICIQV